jgi:predicted XRE-type DNA-binding protein
MRKFLSEEELKSDRKQTNRVRGSEMLSPDASSLDRTKYDLCKRLLIYMRENNLNQRQLAKRLGVVESRVSEVLHYRIKKLTLDRLVKYHEILNPKFSLRVAS